MNPINQGRVVNALLGAWDQTKQPLKQRATILPLGEYEDGSVSPAWPGLLAAPFEGMANFGRYGYNSPEAIEDNARSAFDIAGGAMTGSLAVAGAKPAANIIGGIRDNAMAKYLDYRYPPEPANVVPFGKLADPFADATMPEGLFARRPMNDPTEEVSGFRTFSDIIPRNDGAGVTAASLYVDYAVWAEKNGVEPLSFQNFQRAMAEQGFSRGKIGGQIRYPGLDGFPEDALFANARPGAAIPLATQTGERQGIRAYHGSPHDFDRFDLSKIGTGEGAQAYGHGLYFAESEGVARGYKDRIAGADWVDKNNVPVQTNSIVEDIIQEARKAGLGVVAADEMAFSWRDYVDAPSQAPEPIKKVLERRGIKLREKGRMYEVNIRANPEDFLDWDKPLSQQSESVKQKLGIPPSDKIAEAERLAAEIDKLNRVIDGQGGIGSPQPDVAMRMKRGLVDQYLAIDPNESAWWKMDTKDAAARPDSAAKLREAGIPGIRYLDGMSRGAGEGSSNYVVFDDALVDILRKYANAPTGASLPLASQSQDDETDIMTVLRSYLAQ